MLVLHFLLHQLCKLQSLYPIKQLRQLQSAHYSGQTPSHSPPQQSMTGQELLSPSALSHSVFVLQLRKNSTT